MRAQRLSVRPTKPSEESESIQKGKQKKKCPETITTTFEIMNGKRKK